MSRQGSNKSTETLRICHCVLFQKTHETKPDWSHTTMHESDRQPTIRAQLVKSYRGMSSFLVYLGSSESGAQEVIRSLV